MADQTWLTLKFCKISHLLPLVIHLPYDLALSESSLLRIKLHVLTNTGLVLYLHLKRSHY